MQYDLVIIGSGPIAREAALAAARRNRHVAIVSESEDGIHREARPEYLRAMVSRLLQSAEFAIRPTMQVVHQDLAELAAVDRVRSERRLTSAGVDGYRGAVRFLDEATLIVTRQSREFVLSADRVLIATGTRPARPAYVAFGGPQVITAEEFGSWTTIPDDVVIVGGGTTGREYARLLAALGTQVTVLDASVRFPDVATPGSADGLPHPAGLPNVVWHARTEVIGATRGSGERVAVLIDDGRRFETQAVLWATERVGETDRLDLRAAGIEVDERGRLWCDEHLRTWAPAVYAAGDVVGFPQTSEVEEVPEMGRHIVERMFVPETSLPRERTPRKPIQHSH